MSEKQIIEMQRESLNQYEYALKKHEVLASYYTREICFLWSILLLINLVIAFTRSNPWAIATSALVCAILSLILYKSIKDYLGWREIMKTYET